MGFSDFLRLLVNFFRTDIGFIQISLGVEVRFATGRNRPYGQSGQAVSLRSSFSGYSGKPPITALIEVNCKDQQTNKASCHESKAGPGKRLTWILQRGS